MSRKTSGNGPEKRGFDKEHCSAVFGTKKKLLLWIYRTSGKLVCDIVESVAGKEDIIAPDLRD